MKKIAPLLVVIMISIVSHSQNNLRTDSLGKADTVQNRQDSVKLTARQAKKAERLKSRPAYNPYLPYNPTTVPRNQGKQNQSAKTNEHPATFPANILLQLLAEKTKHAYEF